MSKNQRLLTTDELLNELANPSLNTVELKHENHQKQNKWKIYVFWGIVILAVLHLLFLSLPLTIGVKETANLVGQTRVVAIPYLEGNVSERPGEVSLIGAYDVENIAVDDHVMVYGLVDTTYYWDVIVTDVDAANQTFSATYDGFSELSFEYDDVYGTFIREGNFFDVILYVATQWRGLIATFVVYGSIILFYHMLVIKELKMIERIAENEEDNNQET